MNIIFEQELYLCRMHEWVSRLEKALKAPLPGALAHLEMSPAGRGNTEEYIQTLLTPAKISAVMLLVYNQDDCLKMVLIKRPDYQGVHSGQVSLPGGKFEESDQGYEKTALRETEEEVGISADQIQIIGPLSRIYIPPSNFLVYPYLGFCKNTPQFKINSREVEKIISPPVDILLDQSICKEGVFMAGGTSGWQVKAPYYEMDNEKVWGATAAILSEFKTIVASIKAG